MVQVLLMVRVAFFKLLLLSSWLAWLACYFEDDRQPAARDQAVDCMGWRRRQKLRVRREATLEAEERRGDPEADDYSFRARHVHLR
jgi:hypothetical protein